MDALKIVPSEVFEAKRRSDAEVRERNGLPHDARIAEAGIANVFVSKTDTTETVVWHLAFGEDCVLSSPIGVGVHDRETGAVLQFTWPFVNW